MLKGIWSFNVRGQKVAFTSGIVVISDGNRYVGGDSFYYFTGAFAQDGVHITSDVSVKHHFGPRNEALEELDRFTIALTGTTNTAGSIMQLAGNVVEKPEICLLVGMSKLEDAE